MSLDNLIKRIAHMQAANDPKSPEMRQALTRIGTVLQAQIRLNIRRYGAIDYGGLINSIQYKVGQSGNTAYLDVGSYGIKYAAQNEFGGPMSRNQVIAMLIALREKKGKQRVPGGKGIVTVHKDMTGYWQPRPFMRDAFKSQTQFIIDTLRGIK